MSISNPCNTCTKAPVTQALCQWLPGSSLVKPVSLVSCRTFCGRRILWLAGLPACCSCSTCVHPQTPMPHSVRSWVHTCARETCMLTLTPHITLSHRHVITGWSCGGVRLCQRSAACMALAALCIQRHSGAATHIADMIMTSTLALGCGSDQPQSS